MRIIGPDWVSTRALQEALKDTRGPDFHWGTQGVHGVEQLRKLTLGNIPCPTWTTEFGTARMWHDRGIDVWGRRNNHTQGRDISTWTQFNRFVHADYWVQQIPCAAEFRQHVFEGRAIRRGKKVQVEASRFNPAVHSRRNGWHLDYSAQDAPEGMRELAKRAVAALGYLYGAVDVLQDPTGKLWVLEVNSAPALRDENTVASYVKAIKQWATH